MSDHAWLDNHAHDATLGGADTSPLPIHSTSQHFSSVSALLDSFSFPPSLSPSAYIDQPTASPIPLITPATPLSQPHSHPWSDSPFHLSHHPHPTHDHPTQPLQQPLPPHIHPAVTVATALPESSEQKVQLGAVAARVVGEHRRELKRRKQRDCDLQRRLRENAAVTRLQQLLADEAEQQSVAEETSGDDAERAKRCKADVLERSVRRIERLQMLLAQADANKRHVSRQKSLKRLPSGSESGRELSSSTGVNSCSSGSFAVAFRQSLPRMLQAQMRRQGLESSAFMAGSVCLLLVHVPTGLVADASEQYLFHTHMDRANLIGKRYMPPRPTMESEPLLLADRARLDKAIKDRPMRSVTVKEATGGPEVEVKPEPQYESSLRMLHQLMCGEVDVIDAVWRSMQGDGNIYEKRLMTWVSEWDEQSRPVFLMSVVSTQSIIRMN